jgi:hypothetical protein
MNSIKYIKINNESELDNIRKEFSEASTNRDYSAFGLGHNYYEIDFKIKNSYFHKLKKYDTEKIVFRKCKFNHRLVLYSVNKMEVVNNFVVKAVENKSHTDNTKEFIIEDLEFEFMDCELEKSVAFNFHSYSEKISFKSCSFDTLNIENTTFKKLFELNNCVIVKPSVFNKVEFKGNAVFTLSKFKNNLLFTYSTFEKLGIFSRAEFENCGIDLSQTIINGNLVFFETKVGNYKTKKINSTSKDFDEAITKSGVIPDQNKRETFRIIKHQLLGQNNLIEAEKYAKLEKLSFMLEILKSLNFSKIPSFLTLIANLISNYFKTSWLVALGFIFGFAMLFDLWLNNVSNIYLYTDNTLIKLINPTDFSFYNVFENDGYAYRIYLAGKIVIGFGIYQLIQAFRKFK